MEGPLSKWTNLMKGWQYRWFVLDENAGLLSYYTSREKRIRGERRGCVRLQGAVIGIDDEDDSTFTITVDQKTFHFQAKHADEKEQWINTLEATIMKIAQPKLFYGGMCGLNMVDFDRKLAEADAYLKILIEQVKDLELRIEDCPDGIWKDQYVDLKSSAETMVESIKESIVFLQISKHLLKEKYEQQPEAMTISYPFHNIVSLNDSVLVQSNASAKDNKPDSLAVSSGAGIQNAVFSSGASSDNLCRSAECLVVIGAQPTSNDDLPQFNQSGHQSLSNSLPNLITPTDDFRDVFTSPLGSPDNSEMYSLPNSSALNHQVGNSNIPDLSYSSSEDEDRFYDAEEGLRDQGSLELQKVKVTPKIISSSNDYFDELYDEDDEDNPESMENHGSLLSHLLSQLHIGMDLTKVVLPTFILEKRSLLEMYSDFLSHPDLFVDIANQTNPRDRLVETVRWYLSAFHAGRKSGVAKKPYNPILGECFTCYYELPNETDSSAQEFATDGPVPWCTKNNISFIAEQVSHHPPISAFYAECFNKRISINGYVWTKSKFLGLSVGVHMIGQAVISVLDYEEDYVLTFPNGYGRSILTVPWMELGGKISLNCAKTGYYAQIEFLTKPFYGGKKDQVTADLYGPTDKKPFCSIKGEWNGVMWARWAQGLTQNEVFLDTKNMPIVKKQVKPLDQQNINESRRLWRDVTYHLKMRNIEKATEHKYQLEQQQREEAKERKESGVPYETKLFHEIGAHWVYDNPLVKRIGTSPNDPSAAVEM